MFSFDIDTRKRPKTGPRENAPFRILIMGDFSGRGNREGTRDIDRGAFRVHRVDAENLDQLMGRIGVEVALPLSGPESPATTIRFSKLEDFHPDTLFKLSDIFGAIKEARKKINDPGFFAGTKKERTTEGPGSTPPKPKISAESLLVSELESNAGLFSDLLNRPAGERRESASNVNAGLDGLLKQIVSPHVDPDAEARKSALKAVDETTGALMRALLHYPDFQAVEAAWRGLDYLVSGIETGEELQIYLLDISKAQLAADLCSTDNLADSAIYRLLVEETLGTHGAEPWALVAGQYTFERRREEVELLARIAKIAKAAGAPFIAEGGASLLGCKSLSSTPDPGDWKEAPRENPDRMVWEALRQIPEASWIGLALPPFLLRLPYGAKTERVESFAFEELGGVPEHERYLWGNAGLFCTFLLARSFIEEGWEFRPGSIQEENGFPVHTYQAAGETVAKPCAGILLTRSAAEAIMENGLMPLLSYKNQDRIRLGRFQSISNPPSALSGPWGE
jgi:type VI secretion system protein ImpC